jgi:hypothetical protein
MKTPLGWFVFCREPEPDGHREFFPDKGAAEEYARRQGERQIYPAYAGQPVEIES